jgi:hypothetical protein
MRSNWSSSSGAPGGGQRTQSIEKASSSQQHLAERQAILFIERRFQPLAAFNDVHGGRYDARHRLDLGQNQSPGATVCFRIDAALANGARVLRQVLHQGRLPRPEHREGLGDAPQLLARLLPLRAWNLRSFNLVDTGDCIRGQPRGRDKVPGQILEQKRENCLRMTGRTEHDCDQRGNPDRLADRCSFHRAPYEVKTGENAKLAKPLSCNNRRRGGYGDSVSSASILASSRFS